MAYEEDITIERGSHGSPKTTKHMSLQEAIELGEYNPQFLAIFPEWHSYSRHIQFQYIRKALENRHHHLITQWAEICNVLDFSKKPHLKEALSNIEKQLKELDKDSEFLYLEYSK